MESVDWRLGVHMDERTVELQDRLIDYAVRVMNLVAVLPDSVAGRHIAGQLLRSGTSPAPNYGEAVSAESVTILSTKSKSP